MRRAASLLLFAGLATAAVSWQQVNQLQHDGKTVSTSLRVVDGTLMVSVKDVAAYLGGDLSVANGTATVTTTRKVDQAGGTPAFPSGAFPGGIYTGSSASLFPEAKRPEPREVVILPGGEADNDGFTLKVVGVDDLDKGSYKTQYDPKERRIDPARKDDRLVVVRMQIVNNSGETRRPPLPSAFDATLFDRSGVGVPVLAFDARSIAYSEMDDDYQAYRPLEAPLLTPLGTFEFAAVFSLPKDRPLKRLAVALPPASADKGGTNVLVNLEKP